MEQEQIRLVKKAIHGNAKAYGKLIEFYQDYLYKTAYLALGEENAALDAVGDCILRAYHSIKSLKSPEYFKTWITRILFYAAYDYQKKHPFTEDITQTNLCVPDHGISLEEKIDLEQAIAKLPDKLRTVVILKYYHDLKISEIAYIMEIPEGTVKAYLNRARKELKVMLGDLE